MAEGLFRVALEAQAKISVASAGVAALVDEPPTPEAVAAMQSRGIDISACRARQCDDKLLRQADLVLVMEEIQRKWVHTRYPQTRGKVFLMGHWRKSEAVPDPYGQASETYDQVLTQIEQHTQDWLKVLR